MARAITLDIKAMEPLSIVEVGKAFGLAAVVCCAPSAFRVEFPKLPTRHAILGDAFTTGTFAMYFDRLRHTVAHSSLPSVSFLTSQLLVRRGNR